MIVAIDCGKVAYKVANPEAVAKLALEKIEICVLYEMDDRTIEFIDENQDVIAAFELRNGRLVRTE